MVNRFILVVERAASRSPDGWRGARDRDIILLNLCVCNQTAITRLHVQ